MDHLLDSFYYLHLALVVEWSTICKGWAFAYSWSIIFWLSANDVSQFLKLLNHYFAVPAASLTLYSVAPLRDSLSHFFFIRWYLFTDYYFMLGSSLLGLRRAGRAWGDWQMAVGMFGMGWLILWIPAFDYSEFHSELFHFIILRREFCDLEFGISFWFVGWGIGWFQNGWNSSQSHVAFDGRWSRGAYLTPVFIGLILDTSSKYPGRVCDEKLIWKIHVVYPKYYCAEQNGVNDQWHTVGPRVVAVVRVAVVVDWRCDNSPSTPMSPLLSPLTLSLCASTPLLAPHPPPPPETGPDTATHTPRRKRAGAAPPPSPRRGWWRREAPARFRGQRPTTPLLNRSELAATPHAQSAPPPDPYSDPDDPPRRVLDLVLDKKTKSVEKFKN